jgi:hypothetical protein
MQKNITTWACLLAASLATSAKADKEITYRQDIRPLWQAKCSVCHGAGSPYLGDFQADQDKYVAMNKGPRMDSYADLLFFIAWPDTGALMRRLDDGKNTKDGKPGNMYSNLGATEEERQKNLRLFKDWVGKAAWIHKKPGGITKEELLSIDAKY